INGGAIYYKSTSLADRKFETGFGTRFIRLGASTTSLVNNPSSTKQAVTSASGILILASDDCAQTYMFNKIAVAPYAPIPPTAYDGSLTVNQNQTATGTLSATDPNADALTYSIISNGTLGTATITDPATGAYQYVPNLGASGTDTFTFKVNDGTADSNVATITVTIVSTAPERGTWLLDDGSGSTFADSSGLGNNGTLTGSPSWVAGRHGTALRFNGTTDYGLVANNGNLSITGPITLTAWIKPERLATQYIVKKAKQGAANGYELSLSSAGKVFFRLNEAASLNTYRVDSTSSYPINGTTWMHVAATYDGTTMRLYINGVQEATVAGPASILSNSQALGIGAQGDGLSPLQGTIDEVRLLARAMTATEIQALLGTNGAPTATNGSLTINQDQSGTGTLSATDPNGDPLTYSIVTNGSRGTATVTNAATGAYQYIPNAGVSGSDSFTFKANDGLADSNIATVSVTITAVVPPSAERGTWLLDEGSGGTIADSSGLGNNGTLTGSPSWVAGRHGTALRFNGTTDYGVVPNSSSLNITGPITLSAWIKPERLATQYIVKKAKIDTANGYELSLSAAGKVFFRLNQFSNLNTYRVDSTSSYPVTGTTWMHVAATYDGTTMRLYINGVLETSVAGPASIASNSQALGIGAQGDGISLLQGTVDEARVLNRALTATEIQGLLGP
ncbi:MAG: large repetitive protein, partial [Ilumatobacteraceae bacterium]